MFFNTFSFPQVFPQVVKKYTKCVVEIPGGYYGVPSRHISSSRGEFMYLVLNLLNDMLM